MSVPAPAVNNHFVQMTKNNSSAEEELRIRQLKMMVNLALALIRQERLSLQEAQDIVRSVRRSALRMFPGKESAWEVIYAPRFQKVIEERWGKRKSEES